MREKKNQAEKCQYCGFDPKEYRSESAALPPFTILSGRYLLGREIGAGGFGITYLALDLILERRVAIKEFFMQDMMYRTGLDAVTVSTANGNEEEMYHSSRAKFEKEAKILAHLNNMPGIVQVYDCFLENKTIYIAMEYLEGETLGEYIVKKGGRLSGEETIQILLPIMQSLEKIHKEGIIHRDISPDNIKFAEDGVLKLYDFGGARLEKSGAASKVVYMKSGYTPLEQYSANGNQGPWTDVYALAATMYYCISGKRLPEAPDRSVRKNQALFGSGDVKVSKQVEKVLSKALEIYYEDRYQTMEEFSRALQEKNNSSKIAAFGIVAGIGVVIFVLGVRVATEIKRREAGPKVSKETDLVVKREASTGAETEKIENSDISYNGISAGTECYVSAQSRGADIYFDISEQDKIMQHLEYGQNVVIEEVKDSFGKVTWEGREGWLDLERVRPYYLDAIGFQVGAEKYNGALLHKSADQNSESLGIRVPTGSIFWCGEDAEEQENGMLHVTYTGEDADSGEVVQNVDGYLLMYWMNPLYSQTE